MARNHPLFVVPLSVLLFPLALIAYMSFFAYYSATIEQITHSIILSIPTWLWIPIAPILVIFAVRVVLTIAFLATAHR